MIVTTTSSVEGARIVEYLGLVSVNVVIGSNFLSDWKASVTDIFGGRSGTYQRKLDDAYEAALKQIQKRADKMGADAIVGIKMDFGEVSGKEKSMFMVSAIGTAVKIAR